MALHLILAVIGNGIVTSIDRDSTEERRGLRPRVATEECALLGREECGHEMGTIEEVEMCGCSKPPCPLEEAGIVEIRTRIEKLKDTEAGCKSKVVVEIEESAL
jgi:hypothetical protein